VLVLKLNNATDRLELRLYEARKGSITRGLKTLKKEPRE